MPEIVAQHVGPETVIAVKGAGEKATAVAHRLRTCGFKRIVMTELPQPRVERRAVSFSEALFEGRWLVEGIEAEGCSPSRSAVEEVWQRGRVAVAVDPQLSLCDILSPTVLIDAVLAKRNTGTHPGLAPLVVALGPGFEAGLDACWVVETNPASRRLGGLIVSGRAESDTGIPTEVGGLSRKRLLISPAAGKLTCKREIGAGIRRGEIVARVGSSPLRAGIDGVLWGLVRDGTEVAAGQKVGDVDPRGRPEFCRFITPQAGAIAGGVLEALLRFHLTACGKGES